MLERVRARQELKFFGVLHRADRRLAVAWWALLLAQGLLPAGVAVAMGWLVGGVQGGGPLGAPLAGAGVVVVAMQVVHVDNRPEGLWTGLRDLFWTTGQSPAVTVWYLFVLFLSTVIALPSDNAAPVSACMVCRKARSRTLN